MKCGEGGSRGEGKFRLIPRFLALADGILELPKPDTGKTTGRIDLGLKDSLGHC